MEHLVALAGLRDQDARDERAERDRVAGVGGEGGAPEAHRERDDEERLPTRPPGDPAHAARDHEQAAGEEQQQEPAEPAEQPDHLGGVEAGAGRHAREDREQDDRDQILEHEHGEHDLGEPTLQLELLERLGDQHRARDAEAGPREQRLDRWPAEGAGDQRPGHDHERDLEQRRGGGGEADPRDRRQPELGADGEHQQDHAELGQDVDEAGVGDERHRHVRADQQPGEHVAEHHGQPERLEHHGDDRGGAEDHHQLDQDARPGHRRASASPVVVVTVVERMAGG